tara:strand:+ start:298 stop:1245 length:948 start_codon:yes stop_codon:yes gene_type:complete
MFKKLKSAFTKFSKQAEEEGESVGTDAKRGVLGILTKTKLSEDKFEDLFEELEEELLQANVASEVVGLIKIKLQEELVGKVQKRRKLADTIKEELKTLTKEILTKPKAVTISFKNKPLVVMFVGVNGVGKTTTLAKFAKYLQLKGKTCVFAASDTFRAASIEQLQEHATKLKVKIIKHAYGADPAAVAYDAIEHAKAKKVDVVLVDTAGRQHANQDLMGELSKIKRVAKPNLTILTVDSLTGNDAVAQARVYDKSIGIDATILTKADADDKGGTILSVSYVAEKPILFLGTGQTYTDLDEFKVSDVVEKLFGTES